jgi:hypothetical protein
MDARLLNGRIADIIARLKWVRYIRFSCDQTTQIEAIENAAALLLERGVKYYRLFVYLLVTADIPQQVVVCALCRGLSVPCGTAWA